MTSLDEMVARLPALPLGTFDTQSNNGVGILSAEFPTLPETTLDKLGEMLVVGGDADWRKQIASRATLMPVSSLWRHLAKLTAEGASAYRFPRGEHVAEAVVDLVGEVNVKRLKYRKAHPGKFIAKVFSEPGLLPRLGPVWSDALTTYVDHLLRDATKRDRLDADVLMKALDEAVFVPGELANLAALVVAVSRLPLAVDAKLIDETVVDVDDLKMPVTSTLLTARVLANADSALNRWLAKPEGEDDAR